MRTGQSGCGLDTPSSADEAGLGLVHRWSHPISAGRCVAGLEIKGQQTCGGTEKGRHLGRCAAPFVVVWLAWQALLPIRHSTSYRATADLPTKGTASVGD